LKFSNPTFKFSPILPLFLFTCRLRFSYIILTVCIVASWMFGRYIDPQPKWSEFREASFGHGELKIVNSTHAFWSWHRNDDDEPVKSDDIWITSLVNSGCVAQKKTELEHALITP
jgi:hypothetical protein